MSKRTTPKKAFQHEKTSTLFTTAYLDVLNESVNRLVDPSACIPLTMIRPISNSGVQKLKRLFTGDDDSDGPGVFASTDTPVVVPLTGS